LRNISEADLGYATVGVDTSALGAATGVGIVSLGDGGEAILTFAQPITNGSGWDFAVFENGFDDLFLEFAFVEVSSDGVNYARFPATSLVQDSVPVGTFGLTDATKINNLAGKYRGGYGTPFDLEELASTPNLDVEAITHVKIIDVVGSILPAFARYDQFGTAINEPWPTPFASSGFDLDAVGVIHQKTMSIWDDGTVLKNFELYPNPAVDMVYIRLCTSAIRIDDFKIDIRDILGNSVLENVSIQISEPISAQLNTRHLASGLYFLTLATNKGTVVKPIHIQKIRE
jgi:hypothetical protein